MKRNTYLKLDDPNNARINWFESFNAQSFNLHEELIPISNALNRVTSRHVTAKRSSPAFHGAAMDGIAVNAKDTFGASQRKPKRLEIGKNAFWINTGHPLPKGCNAVIMIENINQINTTEIEIESATFPWQHVRKLGEDMVATEIILAPGTRLTPWDLGALACAGVLQIPVFCKPKVTIIPSGDEIVPLNEANEKDLLAGKVLPEFNSIIFSSLIENIGGESTILPIVPDDPEKLKNVIKKYIDKTDLIIINAGSSAGSHDYTAQVLSELGTITTHGITVMPGKPTILAHINNKPIIGIPGYPVSASIAMEEFVIPLLTLWQKTIHIKREYILASPCNDLPSRPGMEERIRVKLGIVEDNAIIIPLPRGAGTITSLSRADGIISIPKSSEGIKANQQIKVELLRPREYLDGTILAIGSHDNTLDLLDSLLRKSTSKFRLSSAHVGSLGGLMAISKKQCHLAGCHLLDPITGIYNQKAISDNINESVILLRLVDREQGIIVLKNNPKKITNIKDFIQPDIRFINRQKGSGTRVLFDYKLSTLNIDHKNIIGYEDEEYTHMGVAAAIISGRADAGLGVKAAAVALDLDFIPIGVEEYDLVIPQKFWELPSIQALINVIRSSSFKTEVTNLGGYSTNKTGEIIWKYNV